MRFIHENIYRIAFESHFTPELIVTLPGLAIVTGNNAFCDHFGIVHSDLVLLNASDVLEVSTLEALRTAIAGAAETTVEFKVSLDSPPRDCEIILTPLPAEHEKLLKISLQYKPRAEISNIGEEFYELLFRTNRELLAILRRNGIIETANEAFRRETGWAPVEIEGRELNFFTHPSHREAIIALLSSPDGPGREPFPITLLTRAGRFAEFEFCASAVPDASGRVVIAGRRKRKTACSLETGIVSLLENFKYPAWIKDAEKKYIYINKAAEHVLGMSCEHVTGLTDLDIFPLFAAIQFSENEDRVLKTGTESISAFSFNQGGRLGMKFETRTNPVRDESGAITMLVGHSRDVTESDLREKKLLYRLKWEETLLELLTKFTNVSLAHVDSEITEALGRLGTLSCVDRCYIFLFGNNMKTMDNTHEWCASGIEPVISSNQGVPFDTGSYWGRKMSSLEINYVSSPSALPPEAEAERWLMESESIKSLVAVPMVHEKRAIGFIGFDSVKKTKTWPDEDIKMLSFVGDIFANILIRKNIEAEVSNIRKELVEKYSFADVIGKSEKFQQIKAMLPTVAEADCNVLIEGPSGTGKNLIARAIHSLSPRRDEPFIAVNCGAIPESLLESELFGYVKGAFTDARSDRPGKLTAAGNGVILLDEIGEMPMPLQVKILHVIEEKKYFPLGSNTHRAMNARIIAATNSELEQLVAQKKFRLDLYYRLKIVDIRIPPLRERREDIEILVTHFIQLFNRKYSRNIIRLSPETLEMLMSCDFPGNVRELQNMLESAFIFCGESVLKPEHFPEEYRGRRSASESSGSQRSPEAIVSKKKHLRDIRSSSEKEAIVETLKKHEWSRTETAKALNISRIQLWRKITKYGITPTSVS